MRNFAKKLLCAALALTCVTAAACAEFEANKGIAVISREDGSGTRGAFVELTGVEQKDENGFSVRREAILEDAIITSMPQNMLRFQLTSARR